MPSDGKIGPGDAAKGVLTNDVGHAVCVSCQVRMPKSELHAIKSQDGQKVVAHVCGRCFNRGFA